MSDMTKLKLGLDLLSRQNDILNKNVRETNDLLKSIKSSLVFSNVLIFILLVTVGFLFLVQREALIELYGISKSIGSIPLSDR